MPTKDQKLVPGRFINLNGTVLRIRKRIDGCKGCCLNGFYTCPNITALNNNAIDCTYYGVIFTKT